MRSSYEQNNFGEIFFSTVVTHKPIVCVELGILYGYSTCYLAEALKYNKKEFGLEGHLDAYDLFDDYAYKHGDKKEVEQLVKNKGLAEFVTILKGDAYGVHKKYSDNSVHLLHVDINNTAKTIKKIMELWDVKITQKSIILFEGGSEERDHVDWMIKYNKPPIKPEIEKNQIINANYTHKTHQKFPSLTILEKNER